MRRTLMAALAATVALPVLTTGAAAQQGPYTPQEFPNPPYTPDRYITDWDEVGPNRPQQGFAPGGYPNPPYTPDRYVTRWGDQQDRRMDTYRYGSPPRDRAGYGGPGAYGGDRWAERRYDRPSPPRGHQEAGGRGGGGQPYWADVAPADPEYDVGSRYADGPFGGVDRGSYERGYRDERGFDPYSHYRWAQERQRAEMEDMHRQMHSGMAAEDRGGPHHRMGGADDHHRRMHGYAERGNYRDFDFRRDFREDGRRGYYQDPTYEELPYSGPGERAGDRRPGMERTRQAMRPDMTRVRHAMRVIDMFDIDKDGRVTQREVDQFRADRLQQFDEDADEALDRGEYEQLWVDAMRRRVGDRFEDYDVNRDDRITVEEFSARTSDLVRSRDRNRDEALTARDYGIEENPTEDYTGRPEVEAPLQSGQDHVVRDGEQAADEAGSEQAETAERADQANPIEPPEDTAD